VSGAVRTGPIREVALVSSSFDLRPLGGQLAQRRPDWRLHLWPQPGWEQAELLIGWNCPPGVAGAMPRLRLVHAISAGVDNLIAGQDLRGVPVCRVMDESQARGMVEYVQWGVLHFHRGFDQVLRQQAQRRWARPPLRAAAACRVGIMGLGELGARVALALAAQGYAVSGWSRSARSLPGIATFAGEAQRAAFLAELDVLVCLLPLTDETRGILGEATFAALPSGAAVVHCGRGEQLDPSALARALRSGRLRGAIVDVFPTEPLPADDPLWDTPGLWVTPHMATLAPPEVIVEQILENARRLEAGQALLRQVDVGRGY
jgi:glyoxylate/hydroxypyruvate reductase A